MGSNEESELYPTKGSCKKELTREEKYTRIINLYSNDVYKICFYLTKSKEEARNLTIKVFVEFHESFESVINFEADDLGNEIKSTQILQHLTCMVLKKLKTQ